MRLVQYFSDGSLVFNWEQLPKIIREKTDLRDKIFKELQDMKKIDEKMTSKALLELNIYAMRRIKSELKATKGPKNE